jgi:hypothetical protein
LSSSASFSICSVLSTSSSENFSFSFVDASCSVSFVSFALLSSTVVSVIEVEGGIIFSVFLVSVCLVFSSVFFVVVVEGDISKTPSSVSSRISSSFVTVSFVVDFKAAAAAAAFASSS